MAELALKHTQERQSCSSDPARIQDPRPMENTPFLGVLRGEIPALPRVTGEGEPKPPYLRSPLDLEDILTFKHFGEMPLEISCQSLI